MDFYKFIHSGGAQVCLKKESSRRLHLNRCWAGQVRAEQNSQRILRIRGWARHNAFIRDRYTCWQKHSLLEDLPSKFNDRSQCVILHEFAAETGIAECDAMQRRLTLTVGSRRSMTVLIVLIKSPRLQRSNFKKWEIRKLRQVNVDLLQFQLKVQQFVYQD